MQTALGKHLSRTAPRHLCMQGVLALLGLFQRHSSVLDLCMHAGASERCIQRCMCKVQAIQGMRTSVETLLWASARRASSEARAGS